MYIYDTVYNEIVRPIDLYQTYKTEYSESEEYSNFAEYVFNVYCDTFRNKNDCILCDCTFHELTAITNKLFKQIFAKLKDDVDEEE